MLKESAVSLSIIDLEKITSLILIRFCIEVDLQNLNF